MKKAVLLCLSLGVILCACFDLAASYLFYVSNPTFFVANEANREAVALFVDGGVPFMFLLNLVMYPLTVIVLFWLFEQLKNNFTDNPLFSKLATLGSSVFVAGMLCYCAARISAGLTWYDGETYVFNSFASVFHSAVMICLTTAFGLMITLYAKHIIVVRSKATQTRLT